MFDNIQLKSYFMSLGCHHFQCYLNNYWSTTVNTFNDENDNILLYPSLDFVPIVLLKK